jgi:DNA-directed RNA polymerase specialized sigma24 family protein
VAKDASAAIAAGAGLSVIADAARHPRGQAQARGDSEYEQAIARTGRIGLSHREIAAAAEVSHGTVRAILARSSASLNGNEQKVVTAVAAAMDDAAS